MTIDSRNLLYTKFDEHGIPGTIGNSIFFAEVNLKERIVKAGLEQNRNKVFLPRLDLVGINMKLDESRSIIIDYFIDRLKIPIINLEDIVFLKVKNGEPFILMLDEIEEIQRLYISNKKIPGSIVFRETDLINSLGQIELIEGNLGFSGSQIRNLGQLRNVLGDFWIAQNALPTLLEGLNSLQVVKGSLNLKNSLVENLGDLKFVGDNLNLRKTNIKSLDKLEYIGGNLLLSSKRKNDFKSL